MPPSIWYLKKKKKRKKEFRYWRLAGTDVQNVVQSHSLPDTYTGLFGLLSRATWARTSHAEHQRSRDVWHASYDIWLCFVCPVPLIVTDEAWFLNDIETNGAF